MALLPNPKEVLVLLPFYIQTVRRLEDSGNTFSTAGSFVKWSFGFFKNHRGYIFFLMHSSLCVSDIQYLCVCVCTYCTVHVRDLCVTTHHCMPLRHLSSCIFKQSERAFDSRNANGKIRVNDTGCDIDY